MNYKQEILIVGTLVLFHFYPVISLVTNDCRNSVQTILDTNSPEYILIPDNKDLNTFTNTNIQVTVIWNHIHKLLDASCVYQYFVEFSLTDIGTGRHKRESIGLTAEMSPPLSKDQTNFAKNLTDDCRVYSVKLAVRLNEIGTPMLFSRSREFWPAAHRASVDPYSEAVVVKWPPNCNFMTQDWYIRACTDRPSDEKEECRSMAVRSEVEVHVFGLRPCSVFQIDLLSSEASDGVVLWSFYNVKTLPVPILDIVAGHDRLSLNIRQLGCQKAALVKHWRITHCDQAISSSQKTPKLFARQSVQDTPKSEGWDRESGSGDGDKSVFEVENRDDDGVFLDELEDEEKVDTNELYHYDTNSARNSQICTNSVHTFSLQEPEELIVMSNLKRCTDYFINITPINDQGATIQPGEQYATTHWTLCDSQDRNHPDIWIEPDGNLPQNRTPSPSNNGMKDDASGTSTNDTGNGNGQHQDEKSTEEQRHGTRRSSGKIYIWVSMGSAFGVLLLMGLAIWVTKKKRWQWSAHGKQTNKTNLGSSKKCENDMLIANN